MAIGVKETQEIIRQAAVLSRNEPAVPAKLDPQEVGMATGPRHRKRALLRAGSVPDYLDPEGITSDPWQKLDDDIYKFLQIRKDQFGRMSAPPSQQFIAEMESQLKLADPDYELGNYLGLLRQAADLDQTRQTYVTASEKGAFHAFARRITDGRKAGETFDPGMVKRYRELLQSNHPTTNRGLADLFRLISRAARLPLIGSLNDAPTLSVSVLSAGHRSGHPLQPARPRFPRICRSAPWTCSWAPAPCSSTAAWPTRPCPSSRSWSWTRPASTMTT